MAHDEKGNVVVPAFGATELVQDVVSHQFGRESELFDRLAESFEALGDAVLAAFDEAVAIEDYGGSRSTLIAAMSGEVGTVADGGQPKPNNHR